MIQRKNVDLLALLACLILALAVRLPNLTVFITADEARSWFGRSIIFLDALSRNDWANTAPGSEAPFINNVSLSPAPGVTTMWAGTIGIVLAFLRQGMPTSLNHFLQNIPFDPLDPAMLFWLRLPGVLIAAGAVGLTYWWSRALLGQAGAFLIAALWALDPFSAALSRVLGHDSLVSIFMWLSLLAFLRSLALTDLTSSSRLSSGWRPSPFILLSGALAGLACLSKYPALSIGLFIALSMLVVYLGRAFSGHLADQPAQFHLATVLPQQRLIMAGQYWFRDMLGWTVALSLIFILLWPAMWVHPLETVSTVFGDALRASGNPHPKGSFFLGQPVPDPGWQFYLLVAILRTTPVVLLGLLLAFLPWLKKNKSGRLLTTYHPSGGLWLLLILLAYILFYGLLVTYGGKKQDRYLLPIFPALIMLATLGFLHLSRLKPELARFTWLGSTLLVALQALLVLPSSPYYFSYYNPLAGGGSAAARLIQVGWGEGLNEAADYLNTLPQAESLKVVSWYSTAFEPYFKGESIYKIDEEKPSRSSKPGLAADYVVFYVNQTQRQLPTAGALQFFRSAPPVYTVTINRIDYAWIYPSIQMQHVFRGEVRLVGQAELLGYNLKDEAGRPVVSTYPESVIFLSIFWEWQGQAPADQLRVSLVDVENRTRGWGNFIETVAPIPRHEWQDGMIARDEFALVIFPDTPPGEYRLAAWIERTTTAETVGIFPLDEVTISIVPRSEVQ